MVRPCAGPFQERCAIGELKEDAAFFTGKGADGEFVATIPATVDAALLERGRQRYVIYCQPCHDARGDGKGILFQRGNVPTASLHDGRVLTYPDGRIFDVITNGSGLMAGYRWPIPPADRWAIVAYVRDLERKRLAAPPRAAGGRRPSEGDAVMNRKLLFILGPVVALVMFAATVKVVSVFVNRSEYKEPYRTASATAEATPRAQGVSAEQAEAEKKAKATPYVEAEYRAFPVVGSRVAIWMVAQLHLLFAAFVLAVPIFAFIVEAIGYKTGDLRYDRLAYEFTKLLSVSFSLTATFGAFLTFMLIILYPKFTNYLMSVLSPTFLPYVGLFFFEAFFLYTYYYGWGKFHPLVHLGLGLGLNIVGTAIMFIANAWLTFMMSPRGISDTGAVISVMDAVYNFTWMPINVHRVIANVAFGGSVAAAYAAFKFLQAKTDEERAHYDWMGYIGNFVAISAFLPLPFAGYWLAKEIYAYSQTLGLTMMGGAFSWLFIIQAVLIGNLFLAANYYLWLGMGRVEGRQPIQKVISTSSSRSCSASWSGRRPDRSSRPFGSPGDGRIGASGSGLPGCHVREEHRGEHPDPDDLHELPALPPDGEGRVGAVGQDGPYGAARDLRGRRGVRHLPRRLRLLRRSDSPHWALGAAGPLGPARDGGDHRHRRVSLPRLAKTGEVRWGRIPAISQYVLIFIAVTFTWLMGLMGYVHSGLRQHWHVYGVIRDQSVDAFTPTLGFATQVVSVTVLVFFLLIGFVFWLSSLHDRPDYEGRSS